VPANAGGTNGAVDVSEFEAQRRSTGTRCWYVTLPFTAEQRAKVDEVLWNRPDIKTAAIARVISSWGPEFRRKVETVRKHRERQCSCFD